LHVRHLKLALQYGVAFGLRGGNTIEARSVSPMRTYDVSITAPIARFGRCALSLRNALMAAPIEYPTGILNPTVGEDRTKRTRLG
jgi:hypothetical protein